MDYNPITNYYTGHLGISEMQKMNEVFNHKKVLIVDDDEQIREIVRLELSLLGVNFMEAANGKLALEMIEREPPDVVISDISMPVMTGLEMLERLKEKDIKIPVIIVTGFGDKEKMRFAWTKGAFDFIDKPFQAQQLVDTVRIALKNGNYYISQKEAAEKLVASSIEVACRLDRQTYENAKSYCQRKNLSLPDLMDQFLKDLVKAS